MTEPLPLQFRVLDELRIFCDEHSEYCQSHYLLNHRMRLKVDQEEQQKVVDTLFEQQLVLPGPQGDRQLFRISDQGLKYLRKEYNRLGLMKQSEKLDLILHFLYDRIDDGLAYGIKEILTDIGIYLNDIEANRLAYRLKDEGLIHPIFTIGYTEMHISTYGIDYCEKTSFSLPGTSLISLHMGDVNNSNLLFNSGSISRSPISQTTGQPDDETTVLIARIKAALREVKDQPAREELSEGLQEVESKIHKKEKVPSLMWDAIIKRSVDFAQIAGPFLQLAQAYGYVPKT